LSAGFAAKKAAALGGTDEVLDVREKMDDMASIVYWIGPAILTVFCAAYALVFAEEKLNLRKSKPVMIAASLIWILVAIAFRHEGRGPEVGEKLRQVLLDYTELFLFLLSAMSYVNAMVERNVFEVLRARLTALRLSARNTYWLIGIIAFFLSPIADNLTTALVMGTVAISTLGRDRKATVGTLVSVVVAANAGGAFSPFGDITTLMVWQKGLVQFGQFFALFLPALISWLIPAALISFTIPKTMTEGSRYTAKVRTGGYVVVGLFLVTIAATVLLDRTLHLPPFLGMMMGLGGLNLYSYFLHRAEARMLASAPDNSTLSPQADEDWQSRRPFSIFNILEKVEWDTLLFFYGIMLCVGGIGAIGYLDGLSKFLYVGLGHTTANVTMGILSAIVDNIPLAFAVLTMNPAMSLGQWLLLTFTAGVGGSLLSIGSAAGVALMGIGRGTYTFTSHIKWTWAIMLGFIAGVVAHLLLNHGSFAK
jgi:Na+/H+ antiporter NhaD/arsenite permease-like protein